MAVKHKYREAQAGGNLGYILRVLYNVQNGVPDADLAKRCENIVLLLGTIPVPNTIEEYLNFMFNVEELLDALSKVCSNKELIRTPLKALFNGLTETTERFCSPTMSIVLQTINLEWIPTAVKYVLQSGYSEQKLKFALIRLCIWLTKWTCTPNLGPFLLHFMKGLEAESYYDMLMEVSLQYVESLFKLMILKSTRQYISPVVMYMLSRTPEAFHKIIPHVPNVLKFLHTENSEASQQNIKDIVNLCRNLMAHFDCPIYDELQKTLDIYNSNITFQPILINNFRLNSKKIVVPTKYTVSRVGLNNLGNTCYMNSVLQALFMTKLFRNDVLLSEKDYVPLISKLQALFVLLQYSDKPSLSPNVILNLARPPGFLQGHQHDSSEFMGYLLDNLHEQERSIFASNSGK